MKKYIFAFTVIFTVLIFTSNIQAQNPVSGIYNTSFSKMQLIQDGNNVTGTYEHDKGKIEGILEGNILIGKWSKATTYNPPDDAGLIEFKFSSDFNSFTGKYKYGNEAGEWFGDWAGTRDGKILFIEGTYSTDYGDLLVKQDGIKIKGIYSYDKGKIEGTLYGNVLSGKWCEGDTFDPQNNGGIIKLVFDDKATSFKGQWKYGIDDGPLESEWNGTKK